ncbi:hypothetical protein KY313_03345 [Candidatus Woesearchaeota archaeon]|nr:hypothetical protein [Candidatus Woesearchaeota archaeon]
MMEGDKKNLEFNVFMQYKPSRKDCKKVLNSVLDEYIKGELRSKDVDNYFSMISRFGYRLQNQRNNYYNMKTIKKDSGLSLRDILNNLNIKSNYN